MSAEKKQKVSTDMIHKKIRSLSIGEHISGIYLLRSASQKTAQNGNRYLRISLADRSGEIGCIVWERDKLDIELGTPVFIVGTVTEYRGTLQITATSISPACEEDVILEQLLPAALVSPETMFRQICSFVAGIEDDHLSAICEQILDQEKDQLMFAPAAIRAHHAYLGGLMSHILGMLSIAEFVVQRYNNRIDRDLLIAGIVMHDIGKLRCYTFSSLGIAVDYTQRGAKLDHAAIGSEMISDTAKMLQIPEEAVLPLQSLVLHHHSRTDHRVIPEPTLESSLLHQIDTMDSCIDSWRGKRSAC